MTRFRYPLVRAVYAVWRKTAGLEPVGKAYFAEPNFLRVSLDTRTMRTNAELFHPFLIAAPNGLTHWDALNVEGIPDRPENVLYGREQENSTKRRMETFSTYPVRDNVIVLHPKLQVSSFAPTHEGFVEAYERLSDGIETVDTVKNYPKRIPKAEEAEPFELPTYVLRRNGLKSASQLRRLRIQIAGESGVRGIAEGDTVDAVETPDADDPGAVWVKSPHGPAYRMGPRSYRRLTKRKARDLDEVDGG